jgi:hypothetical protein
MAARAGRGESLLLFVLKVASDLGRRSGTGLHCCGTSLFVAKNRLSGRAGSAIWIEGVTVINNMISGTDAGIGVSNAEGGYALISMNDRGRQKRRYTGAGW